MPAYRPLVKPESPPGIPFGPAGKWFSHIPLLGWQWATVAWDSRWSPVQRMLEGQMRERTAWPADAWGVDPRRQEAARFIARVYKDKFGWPNDFFHPRDSFWVVAFPPGDDLCGVEAIMDIEDEYAVSLSGEQCAVCAEGTLGEFVDTVLELSESSRYVPVGSDASPEAQVCPTASIFWTLRGRAHEHLRVDPRHVRPKARLRDVFSNDAQANINRFVERRFRVYPRIRRRVLGVFPNGWTWLALYVTGAAIVRCQIPAVFWWYILLTPLPLLILLSRISWVAAGPRIRTVGELAAWIREERQAQVEHGKGS